MSPRPKKNRTCQGRFCGKCFKPTGTSLVYLRQIPLHNDELEALRLCDLEGMTHEEAGRSMGVSRGTIQRIVTLARHKVAEAITGGHALVFVDELEEAPSSEAAEPATSSPV